MLCSAWLLTADRHKAYLTAVEAVSGADIDFAMIQKLYSTNPDEGNCGPVEWPGTESALSPASRT